LDAEHRKKFAPLSNRLEGRVERIGGRSQVSQPAPPRFTSRSPRLKIQFEGLLKHCPEAGDTTEKNSDFIDDFK
jgi:hypothetical protein